MAKIKSDGSGTWLDKDESCPHCGELIEGIEREDSPKRLYNTTLKDPKHSIPKTIRFTHEDINDASSILHTKLSPELIDFSDIIRSFYRAEKRRWYLEKDFPNDPDLQMTRDLLIEIDKLEASEYRKMSILERLEKLMTLNSVVAVKIIKKIRPKLTDDMQEKIDELMKSRGESMSNKARMTANDQRLFKAMYEKMSNDIKDIGWA